MIKEFLVSREVEIPDSSESTGWEQTSEVMGRLRSEIKRLRADQPVEIPVASHSLDDVPVDQSSSGE
jgi:hypothetical protein